MDDWKRQFRAALSTDEIQEWLAQPISPEAEALKKAHQQGYLQQHLRAKYPRKAILGDQTYLVTYTWNPNCGLRQLSWIRRIQADCQRAYVKRAVCTIEHPETNIHVHVLLTTMTYIQKRVFKPILKYGQVDLKHIKTDNGVTQYLNKESESFGWDELEERYCALIAHIPEM